MPFRVFSLSQERLPGRLVEIGVRAPTQILLAWFAICALATPGVLRLEIEATTESVLDRDSDAWAFYQHSLDLFDGDEIVVFATEVDQPPTSAQLEAYRDLSSALESLDGVRRVDSLSTFPIVDSSASGAIVLDAALNSSGRISPEEIEAALGLARADRIVPRTLLAHDEKTIALTLALERDASSSYERILSRLDELSKTHLVPRMRGWISGVPVFQHQTSLQTRSELVAFAPLAALAIWLLIGIVFRSARAGAFVMLAGAIGNWLMLSAIGFSDTKLSFPMVILPPLILALAAAYSMHLLAAAARCRDRHVRKGDHGQEQTMAMSSVSAPIALSGLTTTIGFAASSIAGVDAVRNVGAFGSLGVLVTTLAVLTVMPACISSWGNLSGPPRGFNALSERLPDRLASHASQHRKWIVAVWATFTAIAIAGASDVRIDTDATRWFRPGSQTRDDYDSIRERLSGISPINLVVSIDGASGALDSILTPETVRALSQLTSRLESHPTVGKAVSIADPILQLHARFTSTDGEIPDSAAALEQYLLLLEGADHVFDLITPDRTATNVSIRLDNNGSAQILAAASEAESWWHEHGPSGTTARATGIMYEFARAQDAIARGQLVGLAVALGAIVLILLVTFGSVRAALATFLPNVAPIAMIYGTMGFLEVPLDAGTVLVGSLALGIAVDDTIHLASAFFEERPEGSEETAIRFALGKTLPAIVYTTLAVGIGFSLLALSDFTFIRNLGILMTTVMVACLLADAHLLPALLPRGPRGPRNAKRIAK